MSFFQNCFIERRRRQGVERFPCGCSFIQNRAASRSVLIFFVQINVWLLEKETDDFHLSISGRLKE